MFSACQTLLFSTYKWRHSVFVVELLDYVFTSRKKKKKKGRAGNGLWPWNQPVQLALHCLGDALPRRRLHRPSQNLMRNSCSILMLWRKVCQCLGMCIGAQQIDVNLTKASESFLEALISQLIHKICLISYLCPVWGIWGMPVRPKHEDNWADPSCNNPKMQCKVCMLCGTRPGWCPPSSASILDRDLKIRYWDYRGW